jgi:branched-subunit amino acid ABC-type transport system permease component
MTIGDILINQVLSGLVIASNFFLVAAGLTLVFGIMGVLNNAHTSFYMIGAYLIWTFHQVFKPGPLVFWAAIILTLLVLAGIGWIIERLLMRHLYSRPFPEVLLITFALLYMIEDMVKMTWGTLGRTVPVPMGFDQPIRIVGQVFPMYNIFLICLAIIVGGATWLLINKTRFGQMAIACQTNRETAGALGIPVPLVYTGIFVIGIVLAGLGGVAFAPVGYIRLGIDLQVLTIAFCVMVIGGMGSFMGTILGAIICGEAYSLSLLVVPELATGFIFIVTGIILVVRPWGLLGVVGRDH